MSFQSPLDVRFEPIVEPPHFRFVLLSDLIYTGSLGDRIVVPAGFVTDFASVPAALRSIVSVVGRHARAAVVHDYLYSVQSPDIPREDADGLFRRIMREDQTGWFTRYAAWIGVRVGGGDYWRRVGGTA